MTLLLHCKTVQDGTSDVAEIPEVKSPTELMVFQRSKPQKYRAMTETYREEFLSASNDSNLQKDIVDKIAANLNHHGFRFFHGSPEDKPFRKMNLKSIRTMIELRMKRLCKSGEAMLQENDEDVDADNVGLVGPFTGDGKPTRKCILPGQVHRRRPGNVFLSKTVADNLHRYENTDFAHEKVALCREVLNKVKDAGYFFVNIEKQTGVCAQDTDKEALEKIKRYFVNLLPKRRFRIDTHECQVKEVDDNAVGPFKRRWYTIK